jgi:hypothetical protein
MSTSSVTTGTPPQNSGGVPPRKTVSSLSALKSNTVNTVTTLGNTAQTAKKIVPPVNKNLLIAALIIGGTGVLSSLDVTKNLPGDISHPQTMKVIIGTYVFILVLSLFDLIPGLRNVVSGLAWLAVIACILQSGIVSLIAHMVNA